MQSNKYKIDKEASLDSRKIGLSRYFLELDKEQTNELYHKIQNACKKELILYLTDPNEEIRWLANFRLKTLQSKTVDQKSPK